MNIGQYGFEEFTQRAAAFHGYPAPGIILGAYMVEMAKRALPEGTLFEAVVETQKCLPDAVQLLTLCSAGNCRMKVVDLGRYAVSLVDKHSGEGVRVFVDIAKLAPYPELAAWLLKTKPKQEQDGDQLFRELEQAGDSVCSIAHVRMDRSLLGHPHMGDVALCPECEEAFPAKDGERCLGCQGKAPYLLVEE